MKLRTKKEKALWKSIQKKWTKQSFAAFDKPYHEGDLEKYLNTQPKIALSSDVIDFCDRAQEPIKWSGCGQFWSNSNSENLAFMLSHLHDGEELFLKEGNREYITQRTGDKVMISPREGKENA